VKNFQKKFWEKIGIYYPPLIRKGIFITKEYIMKLTERDIKRITKEVLNEDRGSLGSIKDDYRSVSQKLARSIEEYDALSRKGEYKRMGDELDNLRRLIRKLKDVLQNIESKL
jgi:polyhydroxyalkanoate synthesis regulator phasin